MCKAKAIECHMYSMLEDLVSMDIWSTISLGTPKEPLSCWQYMAHHGILVCVC